MRDSVLFMAALGVFTLFGCAGSTSWDEPQPRELNLMPGGAGEARATLRVEGSHEDTYAITATAGSEDVTATVTPSSADMVDGVPLEAVISISVSADATEPVTSVLLEAANADRSLSAGTSILVRVDVP